MPTTETSTSGRVRHIRPLPSDSTTTRVPVSATAKLAPETATLARRNFSRRCSARRAGQRGRVVGQVGGRRAPGRGHLADGRSRGSRRGCGGSPAPGCGRAGRRRAARSARPGRSPRRRCPRAASASLSPISWVAIDLTLTTSSTPWARATSGDDRAGLGGVAGPVHGRTAGLVSEASSCSRWRVEVGSVVVLDRRRRPAAAPPSPRPRRPRAARLARMVAVACARLRRSWVSASAARAAVGERRHPDERAGHGAASVGGREDLGQVHHADAGPLPRQQPADVHQARVVAGDQHLGAGVADVPGLVGAHRHRGVGVLDREGAAEAAALLGAGQVDAGRARAPARSSRCGRSPTPSIRSEWQVGW